MASDRTYFPRILWVSCVVYGLCVAQLSTIFSGQLPPGTVRQAAFAIDATGNLFTSDSQGLIRKITPQNVVTIVAGVGQPGFSGDGGMATSAQLTAFDMTFDTVGNLYLASNEVVRKITPAGVISTVAGIPGRVGLRGDGGPATEAEIEARFVAVDRSGNLFIAGMITTAAVRKVTPNGTISTVAGTGTPGFTAGNGPAASLKIGARIKIAVDRVGNLFIADSDNNRVWKVTPGGAMSTMAGSGSRGYNGDSIPVATAMLDAPESVAVDDAGNVFIGENFRVRKVDVAGIITTVASDGMNLRPQRIAVGPGGTLFIMDSTGIKKVGSDGVISSVTVQSRINVGPGG